MRLSKEELLENFLVFDDWEDRYRYLIELGKQLTGLADTDKREEFRIKGCVSQVWMTHRLEGELLIFEADSDALIVRGLVFVILCLYSHKTKQEILAVDIDHIFKSLELEKHLSVNRRNGFFSMVDRIKSIASV